VQPRGPIVVEGVPLFRLVRAGDVWSLAPIDAPDRYRLCRCGRAATMPFCDGRPGEDCFQEEPADGPDPRPFRWDVPGPSSAPALALKPDGPVRVAGDVPVEAGDGALLRGRLSLCRCGASRCQPLCDSSHRATGFRG
jgi:CDGSH-type Zn-finger protein